MTRRLVHRPARVTRPVVARPEEVIAPPPTQGEAATRSGFSPQLLLPVTGGLSSVLMIVVLRTNPLFLVIGGAILVVALLSGLVMVLGQFGGGARARRAHREHYLDYLETLRARAHADARTLREEALILDPAPADLPELIRDPARRWERRPGDTDFLRVRVGTGPARLLGLRIPDAPNPLLGYDPTLLGEATAVTRNCSAVLGVPIGVDLDAVGQVAVVGSRADVLATARSMLAQLVCLHAPDDVAVALVHPPQAAPDWSGAVLVPHLLTDGPADGPADTAAAGGAPDAVVPARRVAPTVEELARLVSTDLRDRARAGQPAAYGQPVLPGRRLVVIVDDGDLPARPLPLPAGATLAGCRVTEIHLVTDRVREPSDTMIRVSVGDGEAQIWDARPQIALSGTSIRVTAVDRTPAATLEGLTRCLAGLRLQPDDLRIASQLRAASIAELLGLTDLSTLTPDTAWQPRSGPDFLRVPIGLDDAGDPVLLDLKESAQLGMGPHGLCVGATGSGKSELLRTLVTSLATSHAPEDLSMILVDYKGGAAFAPFRTLPHVAGLIDNLADDAQLTTRARASINGEVVRRQRLLRDADSSPSITHYRELRRLRPDVPPMPHLLIVIDEFGELLGADPDFVDLLITIGRIGRSIGVHLLLSSQRLEAGRLRGLDTYLSYRIGLRTFSVAESSMVLDTPDAFHLPPMPGFGYLKVDTTQYRRFRAAFVSGPASAPPTADPAPAGGPREPFLLPHYHRPAAPTSRRSASRYAPATGPAPDVPGQAPVLGPTLATTCVERLQAPDRAVRPVWLDPLPAALALGDLPPTGRIQEPHLLEVAIGLLDDPAHQRQHPWLIDLAKAGGHVAVIGAPHSGRSTVLRSLAASIGLGFDPRRVGVYGVDATGAGLDLITGFPHVGGVATRGQADRMRRVFEELLAMVEDREQVFRRHAFDSLESFRRAHAAGRVPELPSADVVLLVDGYGQLRDDFEDLAGSVAELLQRGGGYGIHVVLALTRWNELRMAQQALIGTRIELHVNDAIDSVIDRRLAETITDDQPGRALTEQKLFGQVALPAPAGGTTLGAGEALRLLCARAAGQWTGPGALPIRQLPLELSPDAIPLDAGTEGVAFGVRQDTMAAATIELGVREQHLVVFGDPGAGKTTLLRGVLAGLCDQASPDDLVVALVDPRGDLRSVVPEAFLGGLATTADQARRLITSVAAQLATRVPGAGGARVVVVLDDYDMVASAQPLAPLLAQLPSARELGLHVLLSRPVAGSGRAMYDLAMQTVRETGASAFVMSGERSEGPILPRVHAELLPAGRGRLVRRGEPAGLVQVANFAAPSPVAA